jgi:hypothetical protein
LRSKSRAKGRQSTDIIELTQSLDGIVKEAADLPQLRKADLQFGDVVLVSTRNSVYSAYVLDHGLYLVFGGWFDRKKLSPVKTTITGCTFGGSIIKSDVVAACGLRLEFGNRVVTSPIQKACVIRVGSRN